MKVDLAVYKIGTNDQVKPGDTITSFRGEKATLIRATRASMPGKSGKVLVQWDENQPNDFDLKLGSWPPGFQMEYYSNVFDLDVQLVPMAPPEERTVSIEYISEFIRNEARRLQNRITVFKRHPSYDSRSNLKADYNRLAGMFALGMRLNEWDELPGDTRATVEEAQKQIESLYKKAGK